MSLLNVALVQLCSGRDIGKNLDTIEALLESQLPKNTDLLVLPECFARMRGNMAELGQDAGRICHWMTEIAQKHQCWLVGGSTPVFHESQGKSDAACFVYDPQGNERACYNKIHLFDVSLEDKVGHYRESNDYIPGSETVVVDIGKAKLGLSICYDLRFPELYRELVAQGADILCVPSAFTQVTGEAHWEPLLRARAIENQCYVLAANQGGQHSKLRETYGHSMVISPWGEIMARAGKEPALITAELNMDSLRQIREQLPCLEHRRR